MTAYSGLHFQRPINDWPRAAAILPEGTWIKYIDDVQALDEAKRVNPGVKTVLRHFDGGWHNFTLGTLEAYRQHARAFFDTFIDGTFMDYAHNVDAIEGLNEFNAASHNQSELIERIKWVQASCEVWATEYRTRPGLEHIRLVSSNTAIGNDIPLEAARAISEHDAIAGYHPYVPTQGGIVRENEWPYYSGRWTEMDARFRSEGITVEWLFTEGGPIGYTGNTLLANDGWRHENVCNGDVTTLLSVVLYWMDNTAYWNAAHGGRALGQVLFNSGGASNEWHLFEIAQPEMDTIAAFNRDYTPPTPPPPPPPPRQYARTYHLLPQDATQDEVAHVTAQAYDNKQTVGFSVDDAFVTAPELTRRTVYVWDVGRIVQLPDPRAELEAWVETYYAPVPAIEYRTLPQDEPATVTAPVGTPAERATGQIWPGEWQDSNPYGNRYLLRDVWQYHTGADMNLNSPSWNADRGAPVHAITDGVVTYAGWFNNNWGRIIVIRHDGAYSRYAHLATMAVAQGDTVTTGQRIGTIGGAEVNLPDHLHFDISTTDVLASQPGDWPGGDLDRLHRDYVDPKQWLEERV